MTDRELLELAAKAEGRSIEYDPISGVTFLDSKFTGIWWNPLHNDGDALRLAVKLRFSVEINDASIVVYRPQLEDGTTPAETYEYPDSTYGEDFKIQHINHDKSTRRAIVRAAAEIGEGMK